MHSPVTPRVGWTLALLALPLIACDPTPQSANAKGSDGEFETVSALETKGGKKQGPEAILEPISDSELSKDSSFEVAMCPATRRIARMSEPDKGCQDIAGWTTEPLWQMDARGNLPKSTKGLRVALNDELSPYCVYVWKELGNPSQEALDGLDAASSETYPDCLVAIQQEPHATCELVHSTGSETTCAGGRCNPSESFKPLRNTFLSHLGLSPRDPTAQREPSRSGPQEPGRRGPNKVKVVVIDSAAGHGNTSHRSPSPHGLAMANIIEDIVDLRPNQAGPIEVERVLGISQVQSEDGRMICGAGGYFGYQSELIDTVADVFSQWDSDSERLIVNLSLGWPAGIDDGFEGFRNAVHLGRCAGALVFAAAGNHHPGTCSDATGPMLPAAWQSQSLECGGPGRHSVSGPTIPIVFAVSAVDGSGQPLMSNRLGAEAPLAAFGHHAVVRDPNDTEHYFGPVSGSSVATAVASATAAGYWSMNITSNAEEVAAKMHERGTPTHRSVDIVSRGMSDQQVISPCTTWKSPSTCASPIPFVIQAEQSTVPPVAGHSAPLRCNANRVMDEAPPRLALVVPQPDLSACPKCGIKPPSLSGELGELQLKIDNGYATMTLTKIVLTIAGTPPEEYTDSATLRLVNTTTVTTITDNYPAPIQQAYVTMYFSDQGREVISGNELLILQ